MYGRQTRRLEPLNLQQCYPQKTTSTTTVKQTTTLRPKTTLKPKEELTSIIKINQNKYQKQKSKLIGNE